MDKKNHQPNKKCVKCKRDIRQEWNETTQSFEYAEVFKFHQGKLFCNECETKLQDKINKAVDKEIKGFIK